MTMHYHGTPITPRAVLETLAGRCFCVSFAQTQDCVAVHRIGQAVMLDNGAFSVALDSYIFLAIAFGSQAFFWGNFWGKLEMIAVGVVLTFFRRRLIPVSATA